METSAAPTRCPRCGAAVPPKAPWCTLCLATWHPAAEVAPAPAPARTTPTPAPALTPTAVEPRPLRAGEGPAGWPCSACDQVNPLTAGVCGACGAAFLSGLRDAQGPLLALPVVGDITKLQRSQRLGLALAAVAVMVALMALLGLLLS